MQLESSEKSTEYVGKEDVPREPSKNGGKPTGRSSGRTGCDGKDSQSKRMRMKREDHREVDLLLGTGHRPAAEEAAVEE